MRTRAMTLLLVGFATGAGAVGPAGAPSADLPQSIAPYADERKDCFLPGEKAQYDASVDQTRISLPGCTKGVIPPQMTVDATRVYKQHNGHVVDCAGTRRNEFGTRYLNLYLKELVDQVDSGSAQCAANMLHSWAKADAMTAIDPDSTVNQSKVTIMWALAGLSAAYFKSSETQSQARAIASPAGGTADAVIKHWFGELSDSVAADIGPARQQGKENNLQYWRAWSILPTAMLTQDPALLKSSQGVFGRAMQSVTAGNADPADNGFLPLELKRQDKALRYQAFAAAPLVAMATVSQAYGCAFLDTKFAKQQLASLMERTLDGSADPQIFTDQQLKLGLIKRPVTQLPDGSADELLYLINRIDPVLKGQIDTALAARHDAPPTGSEDSDRDRLGGSLATLADASAALRNSKSPRLAKVCGAPG